MVSSELLAILCCPETKEDVEIASESLIEKVNQKIEAKELKNRAGTIITEKIDAGLIREDKKYLYPIKQDIPIMLIDEAIQVDNLV